MLLDHSMMATGISSQWKNLTCYRIRISGYDGITDEVMGRVHGFTMLCIVDAIIGRRGFCIRGFSIKVPPGRARR